MRRSLDSELAGLIDAVNLARRALPPGATSRALMTAEALLEREVPVSRRLAVYGTLAPGGERHDLLAAIAGRWFEGHVRGHRFVGRHSSARGYAALRLDPDGDRVPVAVLDAAELPRRFGSLDAYEGEGYRRVVAPVWDDDGLLLIANVYESVEPPPERSASS
jgi:gamma-glutamylcyclotransferase (GGCT)/AIG2-like uncharacterized protein YtfP